jgi:HK97 gp10 family phage protein
MIQVKIEGGPKVVAALQELSTRLQTTVLKDALVQAGQPMARRAASLAPKGDASAPTLSNILVVPLRRRAGAPGATVAIGPAADVTYARFQEYGTKHMPAHPFLRPAFHSDAEATIQRLVPLLWRALAARGISSRSSAGAGGGLV